MVLTQTVFAFVVAPFILLGFSDTIKVWAGVYFYALIGVAASFALFSRSLPFRKMLVQRQSARAPGPAAAAAAAATGNQLDEPAIEKAAREEVRRERLARTVSADSVSGGGGSHKMPVLGIADDPERMIDEIVAEVKAEIEGRRRRGSVVQGFDVRKAVQEKLSQFQSKS